MGVAIGLLAIAIALVAFATALVPRWRGAIRWKGTRVPAGVVSSIGFGLAFGGAGLFFLTRDSVPDDYRAWFALALLAGFPTIFVGQWLDFRRSPPPRQRRAEPGAAADGGGRQAFCSS